MVVVINQYHHAMRVLFTQTNIVPSFIPYTYLFAGELSLRRSTDATVSLGTTPDDTLMHGSLDAIVHLEVKLGQLVLIVGTGVLDITQGGGINDVTDNEALDGLILRDGLAGGGTPVKSKSGIIGRGVW